MDQRRLPARLGPPPGYGPAAPRRGHVMAVPFTPAARAMPVRGGLPWRVLALMALLPLYYQAFQYMIDVWPLYTLSKGWPLITLPVTLWALLFLRLPYAAFYMVLLAYVIGLSPALSMLQLYNNFIEAAATTTKVWSFSFYFSLSALLYWIRPTPLQIRRAMLTLSLLTFAAMWTLWVLAPASAYKGDPTVTQIFYLDEERGYRIVLPMGMAMVGTFYAARCFARSPRAWHLLAIAGSFGSMLMIYKQRLAILSAAVATLFALTSGLRRRRPLLAWGLLLAVGGLAVIGQRLLSASSLQGALGNSLTIRQTSVRLALDFVTADPLRLLFGVGATTNVSAIQLNEILGFANFFTTDIGWVGVLLEYGLVGSLLIAAAYALGVLIARRAAASGDPLFEAISDWTLYIVMVTSVYSVIYIPGEMMTATALGIYMLRHWMRAPAYAARA